MADKKPLKRFEVCITEEEKELIKFKAKQAKMSMAKFIVMLAENRQIFVVSDLGKFIVQLQRMGNNLNQMMKVINAQKYVDYPARKLLKDNLKELENIGKGVNSILLYINCPVERTLSQKETAITENLKKISELSESIMNEIKADLNGDT
jgi:hypothetical protein